MRHGAGFAAVLVILAALCGAAAVRQAGGAPAFEAREQGPDYAAERLVGTVGGSFAGAVFEDVSGRQTFYGSGQTFLDGTRILIAGSASIVVRTADGARVEYFVGRARGGGR